MDWHQARAKPLPDTIKTICDALVQNSSNSIANTLELLQFALSHWFFIVIQWNKFQWNLNQNIKNISIWKSTFEYVAC